jgi:hypothetical protein
MDPPPRREPSPWPPLLRYLGPLFALANLSLIPLIWTMISIVFTRMWSATPPGGVAAPTPAQVWLPYLTALWTMAIALVPAQAMLATLCLTWTKGSFGRRLLIHWLIVLAGVGCFMAGVPMYWFCSNFLALMEGTYVRSPTESPAFPLNWDELQTLLAYPGTLPMILLGVQAPFWAMRVARGYRLEQLGTVAEEGPKAALPPEALSIKDIMLATALIAISLALLQFSDRAFAASGSTAQRHLFTTLIVAAVSVLVSSLAGVPMALLFLRRLSLVAAWGVSLAFAGLGSLLVYGVVDFFAPSPNPWQQFGSMCLLVYVGVITYAVGLTLLRRSGWRLVGARSAIHA